MIDQERDREKKKKKRKMEVKSMLRENKHKK